MLIFPQCYTALVKTMSFHFIPSLFRPNGMVEITQGTVQFGTRNLTTSSHMDKKHDIEVDKYQWQSTVHSLLHATLWFDLTVLRTTIPETFTFKRNTLAPENWGNPREIQHTTWITGKPLTSEKKRPQCLLWFGRLKHPFEPPRYCKERFPLMTPQFWHQLEDLGPSAAIANLQAL